MGRRARPRHVPLECSGENCQKFIVPGRGRMCSACRKRKSRQTQRDSKSETEKHKPVVLSTLADINTGESIADTISIAAICTESSKPLDLDCEASKAEVRTPKRQRTKSCTSPSNQSPTQLPPTDTSCVGTAAATVNTSAANSTPTPNLFSASDDLQEKAHQRAFHYMNVPVRPIRPKLDSISAVATVAATRCILPTGIEQLGSSAAVSPPTSPAQAPSLPGSSTSAMLMHDGTLRGNRNRSTPTRLPTLLPILPGESLSSSPQYSEDAKRLYIKKLKQIHQENGYDISISSKPPVAKRQNSTWSFWLQVFPPQISNGSSAIAAATASSNSASTTPTCIDIGNSAEAGESSFKDSKNFQCEASGHQPPASAADAHVQSETACQNIVTKVETHVENEHSSLRDSQETTVEHRLYETPHASEPTQLNQPQVESPDSTTVGTPNMSIAHSKLPIKTEPLATPLPTKTEIVNFEIKASPESIEKKT